MTRPAHPPMPTRQGILLLVVVVALVVLMCAGNVAMQGLPQ